MEYKMIATVKHNTYANVKVSNILNKKGKLVANQFIILLDNSVYFQSYATVIVAFIDGTTFLDKDKWNYGATTSKYRNIFLNEDTDTTRRKIEEGLYFLTNLNGND